MYGKWCEVVNSVLYGIYAFFRMFLDGILDRCDRRYVAESSLIYDDLVVDFWKIREVDFL